MSLPFPYPVPVFRRLKKARLAATLAYAVLFTVPAMAEPFNAGGVIHQYFSGGGDPGEGSGGTGPGVASWSHVWTNGVGLFAHNSATGAAGILRTKAGVMLDWAGWASGSIESRSSASMREEIMPEWEVWATTYSQYGRKTIVMEFEVSATGSVVAISAPVENLGGAGIGYSLTLNDATLSGSRSANSAGGSTEDNNWGTMMIRATLPNGGALNLFMSAYAYAGAGKTYLSFPTVTAEADFSHTLRWGGVSRMWVQEDNGELTEITGAYLPLIGRESGFNYFNAVPLDDGGSVPEPSTGLMLGAGLACVLYRNRGVMTLRRTRPN